MKSCNLFSNKKEDEEKNKIKIQNIVINKINIILNYMIDFQCKYSFIKLIIKEFKDYYELTETDIEKFNLKIKQYYEEQDFDLKKENRPQENNKKEIKSNENKTKGNKQKENKFIEFESQEKEQKELEKKEIENNAFDNSITKNEYLIEDDENLGNLNINEFNSRKLDENSKIKVN